MPGMVIDAESGPPVLANRSGGVSGPALKPVAALEIKWSDKYADRPEALKGLMRFARGNRLSLAWATTRSRVRQQTVDGVEIRQWPAAALAFHYGVRAVQGRLAGFEAQIKEIVE